MPLCATALVTRGYICCDFFQDQLQSCDKPAFVGGIEVRPKVRSALTPSVLPPGVPKPMTAQELRPRATAKAPAPPSPTVKPAPVTATELRPKVTKAEEE
jgi:hypothetical protein